MFERERERERGEAHAQEKKQTRHANTTRFKHEINRLELKGLIPLIKCVELKSIYIILYSYFDTTQTWHTQTWHTIMKIIEFKIWRELIQAYGVYMRLLGPWSDAGIGPGTCFC